MEYSQVLVLLLVPSTTGRTSTMHTIFIHRCRGAVWLDVGLCAVLQNGLERSGKWPSQPTSRLVYTIYTIYCLGGSPIRYTLGILGNLYDGRATIPGRLGVLCFLDYSTGTYSSSMKYILYNGPVRGPRECCLVLVSYLVCSECKLVLYYIF